MVTAKQKAHRAWFASTYGGKKKAQGKGVIHMAKRRSKKTYRRSSRKGFMGTGGFGSGSLIKGALFGIAGGVIGRMINIDPKLTSAAGGFLGGGIVGAATGFAVSEVGGIGSMVSSKLNLGASSAGGITLY